MKAQFCHRCGSKLPENARFCGNCGTAVLKQTPPPAEPDPAPVPEPVPVPEPAPVSAPAPQPVPEEPRATVSNVFTLDSLDQPIPQPEEPVKPPVIFTLDSLPEQEQAPAEPEPIPEPEPQPEPEPIPEPEPLPEPVPAPQPTPVKKKKGGWPRRGAGRTILAVLVCILLFVWSFSTLTVVNVRLSTSGAQGEAAIESMVRGADLTAIPASAVVADLGQSDLSLAEWIIDQIDENYTAGEVQVDPDDLDEYLEKSAIPTFLAAELSQCMNDLYSGSVQFEITAADIEAILTADAPLLKDIFGMELTAERISELADTAEEAGMLDALSTDALVKEASLAYHGVQFGLSWWGIGIMGVILILIVLLLGKVNRSVLRTFGDTGITLMVASGIWCIGGLWSLLLPDLLWSSVLSSVRFLSALLKASLIPSAIAFGAGLVMVLVKVIGKAIVTKSAKKQVG